MATVTESLQDPTQELPFEVCCIIFSFIPADDLVKRCVLVRRVWKNVCDDQTTWRLKCERTGRYKKKCLKNFEPDDWKVYYYRAPYNKNLIKNPNLSDAFPTFVDGSRHISPWHGFGELTHDQWHKQFEPWGMMEIGGDGIQLENPPQGCERVSSGDLVCIATSFGPTRRCQIIDLIAEGVTEYVMDECKLPIHACEWFNNRADCGAEYSLTVVLLDKKRSKIPNCKVKMKHRRSEGKNNWQKLEHTFVDYPTGVRYIKFKDSGRDDKCWSGFYGAKLAGATVKLLLK